MGTKHVLPLRLSQAQTQRDHSICHWISVREKAFIATYLLIVKSKIKCYVTF